MDTASKKALLDVEQMVGALFSRNLPIAGSNSLCETATASCDPRDVFKLKKGV